MFEVYLSKAHLAHSLAMYGVCLGDMNVTVQARAGQASGRVRLAMVDNFTLLYDIPYTSNLTYYNADSLLLRHQLFGVGW